MPRRELKHPSQIEAWLAAWGEQLHAPGDLILFGSGALLWHAGRRGIDTPLPENSMDVDLITSTYEIAELAYGAQIGSAFEKEHGWHVHLMSAQTLTGMPALWRDRAERQTYGLLKIVVPAPSDLLVAKLARGEPRDLAHATWAERVGLC
jgi:hypothetical protein